MKTSKKIWLYALSFTAASVTAVGFGAPLQALDKPSALRMYTLDCGRFEAKDMSAFSDTGEFDAQPGKLVGTCFLLVHPKGTLLWDTGLPDTLAAMPNGFTDQFGITLKVIKPLLPQLAELGVKPSEIDYVAFSHLHGDHTGNASAFTSSTWLIGKAGLQWAQGKPTPIGIDPRNLSGFKKAKLQLLDFDHDVFGDGSVRILRTPGHTPGHQALLVSLAKAGKLLLSGDLFHTKVSAAKGLVPNFNESRAETLASIDRVSKLLKSTKARLIVQHAPEDFASLPVPPTYLD
jgi:N-acyl homoserine lactone hydrolase